MPLCQHISLYIIKEGWGREATRKVSVPRWPATTLQMPRDSPASLGPVFSRKAWRCGTQREPWLQRQSERSLQAHAAVGTWKSSTDTWPVPRRSILPNISFSGRQSFHSSLRLMSSSSCSRVFFAAASGVCSSALVLPSLSRRLLAERREDAVLRRQLEEAGLCLVSLRGSRPCKGQGLILLYERSAAVCSVCPHLQELLPAHSSVFPHFELPEERLHLVVRHVHTAVYQGVVNGQLAEAITLSVSGSGDAVQHGTRQAHSRRASGCGQWTVTGSSWQVDVGNLR